jgi:hypothetical protein
MWAEIARTGRSGDRIPTGVRFSSPFQAGPEAHPSSYKMVSGLFSGVKRPRRGVDTHIYLPLRLKKK